MLHSLLFSYCLLHYFSVVRFPDGVLRVLTVFYVFITGFYCNHLY